jgi:tetratricopeptide (TPR) repeat protein
MTALQRLAADHPVVVLMDDAQWTDDTLLDALEQATVSELPLWICALARPAFAELRPKWGMRSANLHVERLGPLERESALELCRHLLQPATNVPEAVVARLVDRAEAVPLTICDLVNGLRRQGLVRKRAGEVWFVASEMLDELPDSFVAEWIAGRQLDELPKDLAAHARLASLLSPEFTADEVESVLAAMDDDLGEAFPLDANVAIVRLRKSGLLVQHGNGRSAFRNSIVRDAVAKSVAADLRLRIHHAALAHYRVAGLDETARLQRVAWHASEAGDKTEATSAYSKLAKRARERHNYLEAELLYTRALSNVDATDLARRLQLLKGRGIARYRVGRHEGSLPDLAEARELAATLGDTSVQVDVMLEEAMALDWLFEWDKSRELAERARDLVADLADPSLEARTVLALGRSLHRFARDSEAAPLLRRAADLAVALGDEGYEIEIAAQLMLGMLLPFSGLLDEAEERLERARSLCEAKGDELHLMAVLTNRACLWIVKNDRDRFIQDNESALAFSRRLGSPERQANLNAACFFYWRAELEAAELHARRMIEIDQHHFRQGGFRPDGAVLLARILWSRGREDDARQLIDEVRAQQASARAEGKRDLLLLPNDELLLDMSILLLHGGDAAAWEQLIERAHTVAQGQELIEVLELAGVAAQRRNERVEAERWWREALEAGKRIPNVMSNRIRVRLADLVVTGAS